METSNTPTKLQRYLFIAISFACVMLIWFWYQALIVHQAQARYVPPDFSSIDDSQTRKQSFIEFLYPLVVEENHRVLRKRSLLLELKAQFDQTSSLNTEQALWLQRLADRYSVTYAAEDQAAAIGALLKRLNVIPPSLAIAQAANETAWGTSRFATEANNYFGQWCYREGCGLVPTGRGEGLRHEVKSFPTVADSVRSYLYTLNSGRAYSSLRQIRQQLEEREGRFTGLELATGLTKYSERGADYVASIQRLIKSNNLSSYTEAFYENLQHSGVMESLD